jgi:transcriptional regulator with GAF, ATPase, and Fis domain
LLDRAATSHPELPGPDGKARLAAIAAEHHGNVTRIAHALGTSRSQVRRLAKRHGLDLDRYR